MSWVVYLIGVPLGVFLTVQMLSALYSPIDHWHDIGRHRWRVVRTVVIWGGIYFGVLALLPDSWTGAFAVGAAMVIGIHVIAVVGGRVPLWLVGFEERRRLKALLSESRQD